MSGLSQQLTSHALVEEMTWHLPHHKLHQAGGQDCREEIIALEDHCCYMSAFYWSRSASNTMRHFDHSVGMFLDLYRARCPS
jgi:hypothetical protein